MGRIPRKKDEHLRCYACGEYKSMDHFYRDKNDKYQRSRICRRCRTERYREYLKKYYQKHRDTLLPRHRESAAASYRRRKQVVASN